MTNGLLSLVGVLFGVLLTKGFEWWSDRRAARIAYEQSLIACRKRLKNIEAAIDVGGRASRVSATKVVSDEIEHLGGDFDRYLAASIAYLGYRRHAGSGIEAPLRKVLILHNLAELPNAASRIANVL